MKIRAVTMRKKVVLFLFKINVFFLKQLRMKKLKENAKNKQIIFKFIAFGAIMSFKIKVIF
jgi:hypothetical protein